MSIVSQITAAVGALGAAIVAGMLWLFFHDRRVVKEAHERDELEGRRARDEVEEQHRDDSHAERLERLRNAGKSVLRGGKVDRSSP